MSSIIITTSSVIINCCKLAQHTYNPVYNITYLCCSIIWTNNKKNYWNNLLYWPVWPCKWNHNVLHLTQLYDIKLLNLASSDNHTICFFSFFKNKTGFAFFISGSCEFFWKIALCYNSLFHFTLKCHMHVLYRLSYIKLNLLNLILLLLWIHMLCSIFNVYLSLDR